MVILRRSAVHLLIMVFVGLVAAVVAGLLGFWPDAGLVGWIAGAAVYSAWVWLHIGTLDAATTRQHATREDPSRSTSEILIILASLGSIAAVAVVIVGSRDQHESDKAFAAALGVLGLALSWVLVNTLYTLRYASQFYGAREPGVDFNQDENPRYADFAYLAFTIGMTYQVSDTTFRTSRFRAMALPHALLSYLFGAVILASTINLVVGFAGR